MNSGKQKILFAHEEIRKNKIKTVCLILIFVLIILFLSIGIGYYIRDILSGLMIGVVVSLIVVPFSLLTSKFFIKSSTKGKPIDVSNSQHLRVKNLVEGLSISAGLKHVPEVYLLSTKIPNAFAGGFSPETAYIGVTQGMLDIMDDVELEGVIAHEISHIAQYDVLVSTVSISLLSVAIVLGNMLYRLSYYSVGSGSRRRSSDSDHGGNLSLVIAATSMVAVVMSGCIRVICDLVNLCISRKREYIADANAVRLCGYSKGLASALGKLSDVGKRAKYSKDDLSELGGRNLMGMYIFNPLKSISNLFSTHPPIEDRIQRLNTMY